LLGGGAVKGLGNADRNGGAGGNGDVMEGRSGWWRRRRGWKLLRRRRGDSDLGISGRRGWERGLADYRCRLGLDGRSLLWLWRDGWWRRR
jgi:hypothetical protein